MRVSRLRARGCFRSRSLLRAALGDDSPRRARDLYGGGPITDAAPYKSCAVCSLDGKMRETGRFSEKLLQSSGIRLWGVRCPGDRVKIAVHCEAATNGN